MPRRLHVEVVYALPGALDAVRVVLDEGATVQQAIAASGVLSRHPEIEIRHQPLGIYGRRVRPEDALADGDRVELYRRLNADPKQARRERAARRRR
jgi:putative ubiquitin-RnfH superfamily antitoxin RatB of RatAB toxin-antitoxin module